MQSFPMALDRHADVDDALARLSDIHAQVARGAFFRGYRAVPVAAMGVVALVAAGVETIVLPRPEPVDHALYWLGVAVLCAGIGAVDMWCTRRSLPVRTVSIAVAQLVPSLLVGLVLGGLLFDRAELLPGVWTMVFGLGVLASRPYLPSAVLGVALFYVVSGAAMAIAARSGSLASPWAMGVTYGVGQLAAAAAL
ncbi:MAG: hypothetical protein AAGA20_23340, partial [Planctomycetota bacterium]